MTKGLKEEKLLLHGFWGAVKAFFISLGITLNLMECPVF